MSLSTLLDPQAIVLQMQASDAADVIQKLGGILHRLGYVKDDFVQATLAREAKTPTGLPLDGSVNAAMPHVDLEYVRRPAVALATLRQPVIFHNMVVAEEEVPVRLIIMLALDQPESQVEMLQQVATILQRSDIVDRLIDARTSDEIFAILKDLEPA